jgi:hypothetical protein
VTAPKIILILVLTLGIAGTASSLVLADDQSQSVRAATLDDGDASGARTRRARPTTPPAPTTTAAAVAPIVARAPHTSPAGPDHDAPADEPRPEPHNDLNASFDFTPQPPQQNGGANHNAADSFAAAPSCSHQCITKGIAYAHGNDVEIVVETNVPAQIWISVVATIDGEERHWEDWTYHGETSHTWLLEDLTPGVTYYVMAAATDDDQYTSYAWGEFTLP